VTGRRNCAQGCQRIVDAACAECTTRSGNAAALGPQYDQTEADLPEKQQCMLFNRL